MFGRFMGFFQELDRKAYGSYTDIKEYINNLNIGFMPNNIDSDEAHFVPYIRAARYLTTTLENSMPQTDYKLLVKKVEKLKKPDKAGRNIGGVINIDAFILVILNHNKPSKKENL